ncbi:2Fe-2S iron-sulfur cluster-binding protein [Halopiger xanaduensis]|uniref:Ferredoxin n=1 Tax=Halopiger xanaduensis (strain DSM 18323 / JCM 14033 / SH-6) TaxID=797210 RepID=F8D3J7_HALXS|nr:2Fe-2S iron-sulfur cluster-binding protein [Halopiger xanaduensis]AEH36231.1 ferredoxin [Halopiger xanaduensis SH-6]
MTYDVTLEWPDGRTETIDAPESESVLDAAQRAGVRLPYDCRKGTCITCVGRLLEVDGEGEREATDADSDGDGTDADSDADDSAGAPHPADAFAYRRSPAALTEGERADGYVLLCIAQPRADCRLEVGPQIRAQVGDSPWA